MAIRQKQGYFNRLVKKYGAYVFALSFPLAALLGYYFGDGMRPGARGDAAFLVNGKAITTQELSQAFQANIEGLSQLFQILPKEQQEAYSNYVYNFVLRQLILKTLFSSLAENEGFAISEDLREQRLFDAEFARGNLADVLPVHMLADQLGAITKDKLNEFLRRSGVSRDEIDTKVDRAVLATIFQDILVQSTFVTSAEDRLNQLYAEMPREFLYKKYDISQFAKNVSEPSAEELSAYYMNNKDAYYEAEKRSGHVFEVGMDAITISLRDADLRRYYTNNKSKYIKKPAALETRRILISYGKDKEAARQKAFGIYQELIQNPEKFAALARENSAAKSAKNSGNEGFVEQNSGLFAPAVMDALFALATDGSITVPVEGAEGFEILGRVSRRPQEFKAFEEVEEDIRKTLSISKFKERFATEFRQAANKGKSGVEDFITRTAAKRIRELDAIAKDSANNNNDEALKELFLLSSEKPYGFYVSGDKGYIVAFTGKIERTLPPLDAIKAKVVEDYKKEKALSLIEDAVRVDAENAAEDVGSFQGIATGVITPGNEEWNTFVKNTGAPSKRLSLLIHPGYSLTWQHENTIYLLVLKKVHEGTVRDASESLTNVGGSPVAAQLVVDYLLNDAKIEDIISNNAN